eukprot:jgi/Botrbrau1/10035/Bobra.0012s0122.1
MSLVLTFTKGLQGLKVKDVVPYARKFAAENLNRTQLEHRFSTNLTSYKEKYIDTGSPKPLFDVIIGLFIFSYIQAWPQEYRHYKAEQAAKLEGKAAH